MAYRYSKKIKFNQNEWWFSHSWCKTDWIQRGKTVGESDTDSSTYKIIERVFSAFTQQQKDKIVHEGEAEQAGGDDDLRDEEDENFFDSGFEKFQVEHDSGNGASQANTQRATAPHPGDLLVTDLHLPER